MALKFNGFEAGTTAGDGVGVTGGPGNSGATGNDAFSIVSPGTGNTITYSAANKIHGAYAGLFTIGTANGASQAASLVQLADAAGSASFALRLYFNLLGGGFPSSVVGFGTQIRSTTDTRIAAVFLDGTGKIGITGPGTVGSVAIGTVAIGSTGAWRLEFVGTGVGTTASTLTAVVYPAESTTATDTITASNVNTSTPGQVDRGRCGKIATGLMNNFAIDSFGLNVGSATLLGPYVPASSDWVRRSGAWVPYTPFVRRSGAWV